MSQRLRRLYWGDLLSIRKTAAHIGMSYQETRKRLLKLGQLRSKSEGKMMYPRSPFSGNGGERAYLMGMRAGDVNAWKKSTNTVEVRVSTTHPAMSKLFSNAFKRYGHLMRFAEPAYLPGHFRWQTKAHLDTSFAFLVRKPRGVPSKIGEFRHFLAGYSDSECCWSVFPNKGRIGVSWAIESLDARLIRGIYKELKSAGFHPLLYERRQAGFKKKNQELRVGQRIKLCLALRRSKEVVELARMLLPYSKHAEKMAKMRLIISQSVGDWPKVATKVKRLRRKIKGEVRDYQAEAERAYNRRV